MLALSDAVAGLLGTIILAVLTLFGTVLTLLFRSTKAEASQANEGVTELAVRLGECEARDRRNAARADWAFERLAHLEETASVTPPPPPEVLRGPD